MRSFLTFALTLAIVSPLVAQPPADPKKPAEPPKPAAGSLEDLVARALQNNAEIHAAAAKVRSAEAEYQKTKLEVLQKVAAAKFNLEAARKTVKLAEAYNARQRELAGKNVISTFELQKSQLDVERAVADVQRFEADLNMMLGQVPGKPVLRQNVLEVPYGVDLYRYLLNRNANDSVWLSLEELANPSPLLAGRQLIANGHDNSVRLWAPLVHAAPAPTSVSERIRLALEKPLKLEAPNEAVPLAEMLEYIRKKAGVDVPIRMLTGNKPLPIELMAGELPLGAWLQAVEDSAPEIAIAVREYGILVTLRERLPRDAELLRDFWRRSRTAAAKTAAPAENKKP